MQRKWSPGRPWLTEEDWRAMAEDVLWSPPQRGIGTIYFRRWSLGWSWKVDWDPPSRWPVEAGDPGPLGLECSGSTLTRWGASRQAERAIRQLAGVGHAA